MMKTDKTIILAYFVFWLIIIVLPLASFANIAPVVSNVQVQQQHGGAKVKISYDVVDVDNTLLTIMVLVSGDGGINFTVPAQTCTGDVGWGIVPGKGKQIIWDATADMPELLGENYQAMVFASDGILGEDGMEMLLVPAGKFLMGSMPSVGNPGEHPQHTVFLDAFYIDKYEITNAQYYQFWMADGEYSSSHRPMSYGIAYDIGSWPGVANTKPDYPVVGIRWADALAYAKWSGKRLATEAEWEKAASGTEGQLWPWGNQFNLDIEGVTVHANTWNGDDGYDNTTSPVDAYPTGVSSFGIHNMAGNVFEWCADWFDLDYYNRGPKMNPTGPETGHIRVIRGGSWRHDERLVRCAFRMGCHPDSKWYILGFRCVQEFDLNRSDEGKAFSGLFALDTRRLPPWDINRDEVLDIQDLMLVSKNFGKSGTELLGDVNADGKVDVNDLVIVGSHLSEK